MRQIHGFSHVGVSTHDMDATIRFYEGLLGLVRVAENLTKVRSGGTLRQVYFSLSSDEFIVFMEARGIRGIPPNYEVGINRALGVPAGMYHYALKVLSLEDLNERRKDLEAKGVDVSEIIDLGHASSIFFSDPNGLQLELSCHTRQFGPADLYQESEAEIAN
jgi:catechol 2,3-dioxygenase-like lactoylglutathione lyase family enzyme